MSIIKEYKADKVRYLEYGVRYGENFANVSRIVTDAYGVDMVIQDTIGDFSRNSLNTELFEMKTDEFRDRVLPYMENMDIIFIDADHSSKSVISDFEGVIDKLNVGGYIIMHDTYPCNEDYLHPGACNDCYKVPMYIKSKGYNILTLPLNPGVTIVRKN